MRNEWKPSEDEILRKYSTWEETWLTAYTLSKRYLTFHSAGSIETRRKELDLPRLILGKDTWRWCKEDFERAEKSCPSIKDRLYYLKDLEEARKRNPYFEKDYNSNHLKEQNLTPLIVRSNSWTPEEDEILKQNSILGKTWITAFSMDRRKLLPKRTGCAIMGHRTKLGLPNCVNSPNQAMDTEEEKDQIRLIFPSWNWTKMCNEFKMTISVDMDGILKRIREKKAGKDDGKHEV